MTLKEVCEELGLAKGTVLGSFPRTVKNMKKRGIILTKKGMYYFIEYETEEAKKKLEEKKKRKQEKKVEEKKELDEIMEELRRKQLFDNED